MGLLPRHALFVLVLGLFTPGLTWAQVNVVQEPPRRTPASTGTRAAEQTPAEPGTAADDPTSEEPARPEEATANGTPDSENGDQVERTVTPSRTHARRGPSESLEERIARLRKERSQYGIGWPITMISLGGGVFVVSMGGYVLSTMGCGPDNSCPTDATGFLVGAGLGAGFAAWGGMLLAERLGPRRELGHEILELERQKKERDIALLPILRPDAAGFELRVSF